MNILKYIVMAISLISISIFLIMTFIRMKNARQQAKMYRMKKEVTDPWVYWFSYITAFLIISIKFLMMFIYKEQIPNKFLLTDIIPSVLLLVFNKTIGKSVILRAEKRIYIDTLSAEIKDIHKLSKEKDHWMLYTTSGKYPVSLTNTSVFKIAELTGVRVEVKEKEVKKN